MTRAVTADHVLFDECIDAFRPEQYNSSQLINGSSKSFILTAFEINQVWDLGICNVHPSERVILPGAYSAFISKIDNPKWVERHNSHLFGIALSAIISFVTHKACKSTRDDYLCRNEQLSSSDLKELALINPVLTAGPGCTHTSLSIERQTLIAQETKILVELLHDIDYKKYVIAMQGIRLVHLSIINKRDDFGLAYLLVVSAIEAISQKAIKRDKVKLKYQSDKAWEEKAKDDVLIKELLDAFKDARGNNQYLKERYIKFILDYTPVDKWEEYVSHPMQDLADYIKEISPSHGMEHMIKKHWFEKYPKDLEPDMIYDILADSYTHRSCFIHRGEQPPHKDPNPSFNRFFQEYREYNKMKFEEKLLPNYQLLIGISKYSLINWLNNSK